MITMYVILVIVVGCIIHAVLTNLFVTEGNPHHESRKKWILLVSVFWFVILDFGPLILLGLALWGAYKFLKAPEKEANAA